MNATEPQTSDGSGGGCSRRGCLWGLGILGVLFVASLFLEQPDPEPEVGGETETGQVESAPEPEPAPYPDELSARVNFDGTQLTVMNRDTFPWTECEIALNPGLFGGGWTQNVSRVAPGDTIQGGIMAFTDGDGARFNPLTHALESASILCDTPDGTSAIWTGRW